MELGRSAPIAVTFWMEIFFSDPGVAVAMLRARFPMRIKIGARASSIEILEITTPSILAPSTASSAMPEVGRRPVSLFSITQFVTETFLKSPSLSVPNLKWLQEVRRMQRSEEHTSELQSRENLV